MKVLAVADLHLTEGAADFYRHDFVGKELPRIVKERKPEALLILGDLTEEKDRHSSKLVNAIVGHLDRLAYHCPVFILMGNHDYSNEGHPFFEFVSCIENIHFISKVTLGQDLPARFGNVFKGCVFLPHTRDHERDWQGLDLASFDWVFMHQTVQDADGGFGRKLGGIPIKRFLGTNTVSGDIHKPQSVGPVVYVGAPYTINFGDDYKPRMLAIEGPSAKFIRLDAFPQKRLVHIEQGKDLADYANGINGGDILKVRVDVDDMGAWKDIVGTIHRQAEKMDAFASRVEPVITNRTKRHSVKPVSGSSMATDAELVRQFADRQRLSDAVLDAGLDLLEDKK
jgi:DNA repair exonuclease SbcCD nuclease subunit